ncbi:STAS domain-containing protein [Roseomonas sp. AR75]|uniref:STAS domain-containing protein n=1 Tax=Roseomonas sp. AR75 TaxID=2562311 RepID=UPI001485B9B0|nr:STAS domain-containing protein [Roseomonas sp. AR75]
MQIATREVGKVLVIDLAGRLDSRTAGEVGDRMDAIGISDARQVVLNLAKLDFVSSAGLRVILRLARLLQTHGGDLQIGAAQPMVTEVLTTAGFDSLISIHPTEAAAIAASGA